VYGGIGEVCFFLIVILFLVDVWIICDDDKYILQVDASIEQPDATQVVTTTTATTSVCFADPSALVFVYRISLHLCIYPSW